MMRIHHGRKPSIIGKPLIVLTGDDQSHCDYNPYRAIEVSVGNRSVMARPIEFDSDIADIATFRNVDGQLVRPARLATSCPYCGHAISIDLVDWSVGDRVVASCGECSAGAELQVEQAADVADVAFEPFVNPLTVGLILESDLDPDIAPVVGDLDGLSDLIAGGSTIDGSVLDMGPEEN